MDTRQLIENLGGPKEVISVTGLTKGRISQWVGENKIPRSWLEFLKLKRPDVAWSAYDGIPEVAESPPP